MAEYHKVVQGEYLAKIAAQYGFADFHTIWDHPKNAALKQKRISPNVLFPNDALFIPDKQDKQEARGTTQSHKFQIKPAGVELRLRLDTLYEEPIRSTHCLLSVESQKSQLTTDGDGRLHQPISLSAQTAYLQVTEAVDIEVPIRIGHLDPVDQPSGQLARLMNLGYYLGPDGPPDDYELRSAIEEFQCNHHPPLTVDGICGPQTQAKLKEVHGC